MAGRLLFVILMSPLPPTLTVNPPVITETDSVTLHCQTPPSVSVSQCYFRTVRGKPGKVFPCQSDVSSVIIQTLLPPTLTVNPPVITVTDSITLHCQTPPSVSVFLCHFYTLSRGTRVFPCLKTLTGTELLEMSQQSSPAEVEITCFYTVKLGGKTYLSPHSDTSSITVHNLRPPTLTVNPPVITEKDNVSLHCQTPPSVSVSHCYFYTLTGLIVREFSCLKTLTGTELLLMSQQRSPAEVQVKCFYTVTFEGSTSPHSDPSSITVHNLRPPTLTVNPPVITETDSVTLHCQTPPSVSVSHCHFYTLSGGTRVFPCLKTLTGTELLKMSQQRSPAEVQVKCYYTVKHGGSNSPSPHSDPSSINICTVEKESSTTQSIAPSKDSTGLTVISPYPFTPVTPAKQTSGWTLVMSKNTGSSSSSSPTPVKAASAEIWKFVAVVAGCGVTVGVILLVSVLLCNNRRTAGPDEVKRQGTKVEYSDTYHMYCTIPEEPAASDLMMGQMYSTVQSH
ncbi:hypothetical protein JOQ06_014649 [Pogonophryne albipinna]|uniref:Uncharacterized protein n=1 Tax=Pogonophryne albipinna TaxID=1090488 RepID=A0AAD6AMC4_9TELE|nr:hypothetical protein JOQ06_014649 [Pogonophryne albipinna]